MKSNRSVRSFCFFLSVRVASSDRFLIPSYFDYGHIDLRFRIIMMMMAKRMKERENQ